MPRFSRRLAAGVSFCALLIALAGPAEADHVTGAQAQGPSTLFGTSGSSREHIVSKNRLFCYAGTLGALVTADGKNYVLSNNHVLAKENRNLDQGTGLDEQIIQPGLLDQGQCTINTGSGDATAAVLSDYVEIYFSKGKTKPDNFVDAAIAEVVTGQLSASGEILGTGPLGVGTLDAAMDMAVQKTGRTTGHTFGTVVATQVTIDVKYDSGTARFVDQLRIRHVCDGADFSQAGDSGSLVASVPSGGRPVAVGLLFAGGDVDTFANPIGAVLDALAADAAYSQHGSVSMVGASGSAAADVSDAGFQSAATNCDSGGNGGRPGGRPFDGIDPVGLSIAGDVKARNSKRIFALPDVVGHGIGVDEDGNAVIEIYVANQAKRAAGKPLPTQIEGVPVRVVATGRVRAF